MSTIKFTAEADDGSVVSILEKKDGKILNEYFISFKTSKVFTFDGEGHEFVVKEKKV